MVALELTETVGEVLLHRWLDKWSVGDLLSQVGLNQSDHRKDYMLPAAEPVDKSKFYGGQAIKNENIFSTEESLQFTEI